MTLQAEPANSPPSRRMPVIFAAHGAPILLDDAAWMGELAAWAGGDAAAAEHPDGLGALGAAADDAGRHAHGAARLRLLRVSRAVLPDHVPRARARPSSPRASASCCAQQGHRRRRRPGARARPRGLRAARRDVPRRRRARAPDLDARPRRPRSCSRSAGRSRRCATKGCSSSAAASSRTTCATRSAPASRRGRGSSTPGRPTRCSRFDVDALLDFQRPRPGGPDWPCRPGSTTRRSWSPRARRPTSRPRTTFPITGFWMDGAFTKRSVQFG